MSTAYPRVHVVGSGAYYSYRPLTKNIEKVERNYYRDCSSKPKDFGQYMAAMTTSRGDGYRKVPSLDHERDYGYRSLSLPPLDRPGRKHIESDFDEDEASIRRYLHAKELLREKKEMAYDPMEDVLYRLRRKHPYRLLVEDEVVPPHESSVWPHNRKHFDLVSSYDTMIDYLGISDK